MVCGAPNARAGMTAALAKLGARLAGGAHGQGSGRMEDAVPLQAAMIRGVQSEGMLCSEARAGTFQRSRRHPRTALRRAAG